MEWEYYYNVLGYPNVKISDYLNNTIEMIELDDLDCLEDFRDELNRNLKIDWNKIPLKGYVLRLIDLKNLYSAAFVGPQSLKKSNEVFQKFMSGENVDISKKCSPIYFMTVVDSIGYKNGDYEFEEKIVYVGKTNVSPKTKKGRFYNGHAAITKLHNPRWSGEKKLYLAQVNLVIGIKENWLSIDKDHSRDYKILIPLEWAPVKLHSKILSNVEALMIKSLNPELNIQLVKDGVENKRKVRSKYNYSVQLISNIKGINPSTPLTKTFEIKKIIEIDRSKMQFKASGQVEFYNILK